jgi:histidinol-phosphate aminotransferase
MKKPSNHQHRFGAIKMSRFWSDRIGKIQPYVPGDQPEDPSVWVKVNTNENPYPPSPRVIEAVLKEMGQDGAKLRLYPSADAAPFLDAVCELHGLQRSQVFAGNGSDEILAFSFLAFWDKDRPVSAPAVTYSFYPVYANIFGIRYRAIPMKNVMEVDYDAIIAEKGGVVLANPNAPTSISLPLYIIRRIIEAHPDDVVLVDEAYMDYGNDSAIGLISEYNNLLVVRTLSKSHSLAGMRIGYAAGNPELIEGLRRVKDSFNSYTLDRLAIAAGAAALRDRAYFEKTRDRVIATRERIGEELKAFGFMMPKSSTNFLFVTHPQYPAKSIFDYLKGKKILVRHFNSAGVGNFLRISVGTDMEMDKLVSALKEFIGLNE